MNIVRCERGHFYDADVNDKCPNCAVQGEWASCKDAEVVSILPPDNVFSDNSRSVTDELGIYIPAPPDPHLTGLCVDYPPMINCKKCGRPSSVYDFSVSGGDGCPDCGSAIVHCTYGHEYDENFFDKCPHCINMERNAEFSLSWLKRDALVSDEQFEELKQLQFKAGCYSIASAFYREKYETALKKLGLWQYDKNI